ncbi:MAG: class I SAM-dependent methyltransferase [Nitrospinota bacterium]|nr:class I SAM-dependent methyltransferase [Nitrospinota bacterium]
MTQDKQSEWYDQWSMLSDEELFLFEDWIAPNTLEGFRNLDVLECGCGGGQHTAFMAPFARSVTAVDLNTITIAEQRCAEYDNVTFLEADIATMDLKQTYDVVISIGVVHHTDDPDRTIANLTRHVKPGGRLIVWVYSEEGNFLVKNMVEPIRRTFLTRLSRTALLILSKMVTASLYPVVYTIYLLPLPFLPYFQYFGSFRNLSFGRNVINVFDKLNAPQTDFINRARVERWFGESRFDKVEIAPYKGVSYRASGVLKEPLG